MDGDALELDTRRAIYQFILGSPGAYLRQMQDRLGFAVGQLEYHLDRLVKAGLISAQDDGFRKRYYATSQVSHSDKPALSMLRQEIPRRVIMHALLHPGVSFQTLTSEFKVSKSTMSFHLKKLTEAGVLEARKEGRQTVYSVPDSDRVARLILQYRESFLDRMVDRFAGAWMELE